ncbi:MAG: radical SAM protein, partial [Planctomycetota bacterium]
MLIDRFGRRHTRLRISVTDRCNLRCTYCMPESNPDYMPRDHLLTFEEIDRIVRVAAGMGVTHVRLTGGEPLVRPQIDQLVQRLNAIPAIQDVSITTNAILIPQHAQSLWDAGLRNVNISCDALERKVFAAATRRDLLPTVLDGIDAARSIGMNVKINAIAQRGITEGQLAAFAEWTRRTNIPIRFIEFMPLDADQHWSDADVYSGREILQQLELLVMPLVSIDAEASQMNTEQAPA